VQSKHADFVPHACVFCTLKCARLSQILHAFDPSFLHVSHVCAIQLATARVRLHHDLSPSKVTKGSTGSKSKEAPFKSKDRESATNIQQTSRAGGFLCPPTAELSALFNQGSATDEPHTNIYDHSHHHALEASPHRDLGKNRSQSRSGGIVPKSNIGSNDNEYNNNGVGNNPAEMLGDGALTSGVASPGCCCGTCTSCTLLKARRVPRQLMAKGNDALGGVGSKQLNQLERDTQRAQVNNMCSISLSHIAFILYPTYIECVHCLSY